MKIFCLVLLSAIAVPAYAQGLLDALEQYQNDLPSSPVAPSTQSAPPVGVSSTVSKPSDTNNQCTEEKQTSLPLKYLTGLILQKDPKLDINHDSSSGVLRISSSAKMIGNCNSMIQWTMNKSEIDGKNTYSIEVKFKEGEQCPAEITNAGDKKCYKVAKMNGQFPSFEMKPFSNDIQGFQSCLEASGVVGPDKKINSSAIYKQSIQETFTGLQESGKIVFQSHGPVSSQVDPRFALDRLNGCDVYEQIHPNITMLYSANDLETQRLQSQADELAHCPVSEYQRVADFVDRYNNFAGQLGSVRDSLIKQAAQRVAKLVADGKFDEIKDEDWKIIDDFDRYIVTPKKAEIKDLFESMQNLEGTELQNAKSRLAALRTELESYSKAPYFAKATVEKLLANGRFEDAERAEGIRIAVAETVKIGKQEGNKVVTPAMAMERIALAKGNLKNQVAQARENYDIRTGSITGMSQTYAELAKAKRNNIDRRTQNYTQEMQSEYARIQQGGYCYRYFRNTQKCIQDSMQRIQELQAALQQLNAVDQQAAAEFDQKAQQYAKMEQEGRVYVAKQNGEEVPREPAADNTVPAARPADANAQAANGQQTMMPPWMQQQQTQPYANNTMMNMQMNPYQNMYGQNSNYMGQTGFNVGFGYQGSMGQNYMGMSQPQYGQVGMNWLAMGQQQGGMYGNQMYGNQMYGNQMYGQTPYYQSSPYGQMYGQSPYMQNNSMPWMNMGYQYPTMYR